MIVSYKQKFPWKEPTNFKEKILAGTKIHTIREDRSNRWHQGLTMQHCYYKGGMSPDFFFESEYKWQQPIMIFWKEGVKEENGYHFRSGLVPTVMISGTIASKETIEQLARNDGFDSGLMFLKYFNKDFSGKILHWTNLKYK